MVSKQKQRQITVIVDTRETTPYLFQLHGVDIVRLSLAEGDYSAVGYEKLISIERKTKSDAYKSLGKDDIATITNTADPSTNSYASAGKHADARSASSSL